MLDHLQRLHDFYGEIHGVRVARKHIGWYLKGRPESKHILYDLMRAQTAKEQFQLLDLHFLDPFKPGLGNPCPDTATRA